MTNEAVTNIVPISSVTRDNVTDWNGTESTAYILEPHEGQVGNEVLYEIENLIKEYVFCDRRDSGVMTTWIGHANVFPWFRYTPRLGFTAGIEGCGKTQALQVCQLLTNNSFLNSDATSASFFTLTQQGDKAIYVDEMSDLLKTKDRGSLITALKTGVQSNGYVTRVEMTTGARRVMQFSTYAAVAFGGVGVDALLDSQNRSRCHWIHMRRAFPDEQPETLDARFDGERFKEVGGRYLRWLHQNEEVIRSFDSSSMPEYLYNRERDKWLPLFAIASAAGGDWLERIRQYSLEAKDSDQQLTDHTRILKATQDIYMDWDAYSVEPRDSKIVPPDFCRLLAKWKDEDGYQPYARFYKSSDPDERVIRTDALLKLLRPYTKTEGHRSDFDKTDRKRGYLWGKLLDAADRHLPDEYRIDCHTVTRDKGFGDD